MSYATLPEQSAAPANDDARTLLEFAPDGIFVADTSGRCTYVNGAAARMLGRDKSEILDLELMDLVHPAQRSALARDRDAMLSGEACCSEWKLQRKDGSWIDVEVTAGILPDGRWQGFMRDISRRKAREAGREALLRRLESKAAWLEAVFERLPVGVVLLQESGHMMFNHAAEDLLGPLCATGGARQYVSRIFYADGRPVAFEDFPSTRALRDGERLASTEFLLRRPDGRETDALTSAAPIRDADGTVLGAVVVFQDVTERVRLQRAMRENERLMDAVFELMPTGVRIADVRGTVVRTNRAARELWRGRPDGPTEGEMKAWWVASGEPLEHADWPARRAVHGETISNELVRMQCFDGSFRTVMKCAAPLRDEQGRITGAVVVDEDVTELYEAKEKLRAGEHLFRTVFELLPVGVYIADGDGKVMLGNPEGERIWQGVRHIGPDRFDEYKGWWIDSGERIRAEEWGVARAVHRGETARSELIRIEAFDGSTRFVMSWAAPLRSDGGEITGAVAVNQDVTALYHTQEQLRHAVQEREHILAVVAHDLRNPLNALVLQATACERKMDAMPACRELRRWASSMREVAQATSGLVDDLLAVSVGSSGRSMLKLAAAQPEAVVRGAAERAGPAYAAAGLELVVQVAPELPTVQLDVNRLQRVFANLLDNALKFTQAGGRVVLDAEPQPGAVLFGVANSGAPLPPEQLDRMFQPFWQGQREDRRGAGLGMSICRSIIEAHGGSIWAEATPGMRVHVRFLLPIAIPKQGAFRAGA